MDAIRPYFPGYVLDQPVPEDALRRLLREGFPSDDSGYILIYVGYQSDEASGHSDIEARFVIMFDDVARRYEIQKQTCGGPSGSSGSSGPFGSSGSSGRFGSFGTFGTCEAAIGSAGPRRRRCRLASGCSVRMRRP